MAADLGTLQFFPNITGNESTFRELAYTGRSMNAKEAKDIGYVSKIVPTKKDLDHELLLTAKAIAEKSPVGIYTLKQVMKREQYKKVQESLEYMARVNSSMLLTKDMMEAVSANLQKKKPDFSKLWMSNYGNWAYISFIFDEFDKVVQEDGPTIVLGAVVDVLDFVHELQDHVP